LKCIILGFDGLEYGFVEKLNLKTLKQAEYGKIRIPKELYIEVSAEVYKPVYEPWTPLVWYSLITGKMPSEDFKRDMMFLGKWNNKVLNYINNLMQKLIKRKFEDSNKIKKLLEVLGFHKRLPILSDYGISSIFDLTRESIAIDVPTYSENWPFGIAAKPNENIHDFINRALEYELIRFNSIRKTVLSLLKKDDWTLLMMYSKLLDTFGELSYNDRLIPAYFMVNDFVEKVTNLTGKSCFILIISDHGIERMKGTRFGKHSDHGFYSVNIPVGFKNPEPTEFFDVINKALKARSNQELFLDFSHSIKF
jgi:hypothetical protein